MVNLLFPGYQDNTQIESGVVTVHIAFTSVMVCRGRSDGKPPLGGVLRGTLGCAGYEQTEPGLCAQPRANHTANHERPVTRAGHKDIHNQRIHIKCVE